MLDLYLNSKYHLKALACILKVPFKQMLQLAQLQTRRLKHSEAQLLAQVNTH